MSQQYFLRLPFRHLFKNLILSGLSMTALMSISLSVSADDPVAPPVAIGGDIEEICQYVYAVHDGGLNDTQIVRFGSDGIVEPFLPYGLHPGLDIEGMDVDSGGMIIGSSGDDGEQPGRLYKIYSEDGWVEPIGDICFDFPGNTGIDVDPELEPLTPALVCGKEVSAISFNPVDDSLWGWAEECGLIKIDLGTADAELVWAYPKDGGMTCLKKHPPRVQEVEDMTWDNKGEKIYYALRSQVWVFDTLMPLSEEEPKNPSKIANLGRNVEALEMFSGADDKLLLNVHNSSAPRVLDVITGNSYLSDITVGEYNDIEAIGTCLTEEFPPPLCVLEDSGWIYTKDSIDDSSGTSPESTRIKVGNTYFEIYGMAVRVDKETVTVALNSRLPVGGVPYNGVQITWGDVVFDFNNGKKYGIRFDATNDSLDGSAEVGLYDVTEFKSVSKANAGHTNFSIYDSYIKRRGGNPLLGDLPNLDNGYFGNYDPMPTSIETGTKIANDGFVMLDADELATRGLDFASEFSIPASAYDPNNPYSESNPKPADELGEYTFGFRFNRQDDMTGAFKAFVFIECGNDGILMDNSLPSCL
jgi:hypothetical protein